MAAMAGCASQPVSNTYFDYLRELRMIPTSEWDPRLKAYAEATEAEKQRLQTQLKPEVLASEKYYLLRKQYLQRKEDCQQRTSRTRSHAGSRAGSAGFGNSTLTLFR